MCVCVCVCVCVMHCSVVLLFRGGGESKTYLPHTESYMYLVLCVFVCPFIDITITLQHVVSSSLTSFFSFYLTPRLMISLMARVLSLLPSELVKVLSWLTFTALKLKR